MMPVNNMFVLYVFLVLLVAVVGWLFLFNLEHAICFIRGCVPNEPSAYVLRRAVADEINAHYADMKTVCDIGAGYGGLMRYIARNCSMSVIGLENMWISATVSWIADKIHRCNSKTIFCDAFKYMDAGHRFDIGVAYLGPGVNDDLGRFCDNFKVLITLDVPIKNLSPTRVVDVGHGFTRYGRAKYPHRLYVYEF